MRILVTGANGQLGCELRSVLEEKAPGVTLYTDIQELDLTNRESVREMIVGRDITHVINCAAYTDVDRAEEEKLQCSAVNVDAVKNIAAAANDYGVKVLHISTDYVFDGKTYRPYTESDKVNPIGQYGTTKRHGETALLALAPDSIVIRTSWLYSPHGRNFVKTIMSKLDQGAPLSVVADQTGTPTYALDLARAIYNVISCHQWVPGIFHYSDYGVASWYDFAMAIAQIGGYKNYRISPVPTSEYPTAADRPFYTVMSKDRIRRTYAVEVPYWRDSLEHCIGRLRRGLNAASPQVKD